jgi:GNAT superfamily N-acetyltransferase
MKTNIRLAVETDASQIARVHIVSWQTIYRGHIPDHVLNNLSLENRTQEWLERLQTGVVVWVIELNNKIIGFASICPTRDSDDDPKRVAEISAIYLLPEFWRQGLGQQLCQAVFKKVFDKGFKEVTVWVLESNSQARHFYETVGFGETGNVEIDHIGCESLRVIRYRKIF